MAGSESFLWRDLSLDDLTMVLGPPARRRFSEGEVLLVEGEMPADLYVVESGIADIYLADGQGGEKRVNHVGPGGTLGEISFLTGLPATATVSARTEMVVISLSRSEFVRLAAAYPRIYQELSLGLAERLVQTSRFALAASPGKLTFLEDHGAPNLLGYALSCALAWHSRDSVLHLMISPHEPSPEARLLARWDHAEAAALSREVEPRAMSPARGERRALLAIVPPVGAFAPGALFATLDDLRGRFSHVLVQAPAGLLSDPGREVGARSVHLTDSRDPIDAVSTGGLVLRGWGNSSGCRVDSVHALWIPLLTAANDEELRAGFLANRSPAGAALGRAARDIGGFQVGLALGAGSMRGYAHLGVLRVLEQIGLSVDFLAGTSIGSAVAGLHAAGYSLEQGADEIDKVGRALWRFRPSATALLSNAGLSRALREVCAGRRIEDLAVPLAIVAVDIVTGREVIFRRGPTWLALLASTSIPGIFPPCKVGSRFLVDGGVLNPVPSTVAADMGADVVIAVDLSNRSHMPTTGLKVNARGAGPNLVRNILTSIDLLQSRVTTHSAASATIVIEPDLSNLDAVGLREFSKGRQYIPAGEMAARAALPRLAEALPWLRDV
jgi:NTE family protein